MKKSNPILLGIIGCGYWGPNLVRNFNEIGNCTIKKISDLKTGRLEFIKKKHPDVEITQDYKKILNDEQIQAVCIATPVRTHYALAKESILSGKHTFVEKPLASTAEEAAELVELAKKWNRVLMVGHIFQYTPAVKKIAQILDSNETGKLYYIDTSRINPGPPESEVDVIWDLAVHDISIVLHLLKKMPCEISAFGNRYSQKNLTDVAYIKLKFSDNILAVIYVSWLSACKTRLTRIMGSKGTIIYDDLSQEAKVKIYSQAIDNRIGAKDMDTIQLGYQTGAISVPVLENYEPLKAECEHFIRCIVTGEKPISDGEMGYNTVKILEIASQSTKENGKTITL